MLDKEKRKWYWELFMRISYYGSRVKKLYIRKLIKKIIFKTKISQLIKIYTKKKNKSDRSIICTKNYPISIESIIQITKKKAREWDYLMDKLFGIVNYITPPYATEDNYEYASFDCDDFASFVYSIGIGYDPVLLTYIPSNMIKKQAHTVCILNVDDKVYLFDWYHVTEHATLEEAILKLEERRKLNIVSVHLAKFNYDKQRLQSTNSIKTK